MSPMWRASSITLAVALVSLGLGQYLDSQSPADGGANIGSGFLVMVGWGVGVLGVLILASAIVGDLARAEPKRDRQDENE
jgi:hypothetical protein